MSKSISIYNTKKKHIFFLIFDKKKCFYANHKVKKIFFNGKIWQNYFSKKKKKKNMLSIFNSIKNYVQIIQQITLDNGIVLKLNKISSTAKIIHSPEAHGEIIIPNSVIYESKEYFIDSVDCTFKNSLSLFAIDFSQNSRIKMITSECFNTSIEVITFPPSLEKFKFTRIHLFRN